MGNDTSRILLRPHAPRRLRTWRVGPAEPRGSALRLVLAVRPHDHSTFASLASVLDQLEPRMLPGERERLARLRGYLRDALVGADDAGEHSHGRFLTEAVAFAVLRRISRESVYTARVIDLAARLLNAVLARLAGGGEVWVGDVDALDRPTLKVLARATLVQAPGECFRWVWTSRSDPAVPYDGPDLYLRSRNRLLQQLLGIVEPHLERVAPPFPLERPPVEEGPEPLRVASALVMQNYDACFLWAATPRAGATPEEAADRLRLLGLAAVNVGETDLALETFAHGEEIAPGNGLRAHLCYLQGLTEAKRGYDLAASAAHYRRGLGCLDAGAAPGEDEPLERAWLCNGMALNESIQWRRNPEGDGLERAFQLLCDASRLVRDGGSPARNYLRMNLVANAALLMEMRGEPRLAVQVLQGVFAGAGPGTEAEERHLREVIGYRTGVLEYRAGRLDDAADLVRQAAEEQDGEEAWPLRERVLRTLGRIELERGHTRAAAAAFEEGLELTRVGRAAQGAVEHARGLLAVLLAEGRGAAARALRASLAEEEELEAAAPAELTAADPIRLAPQPSPKLPAYLPEIDLEEIPAIDINRYLVGVGAPAGEAPWRQ